LSNTHADRENNLPVFSFFVDFVSLLWYNITHKLKITPIISVINKLIYIISTNKVETGRNL
jgi:hypothetical protein